MMATVPHVTSGFGLRKFQAVGFLLTRVYVTAVVIYFPSARFTYMTSLCSKERVC